MFRIAIGIQLCSFGTFTGATVVLVVELSVVTGLVVVVVVVVVANVVVVTSSVAVVVVVVTAVVATAFVAGTSVVVADRLLAKSPVDSVSLVLPAEGISAVDVVVVCSAAAVFGPTDSVAVDVVLSVALADDGDVTGKCVVVELMVVPPVVDGSEATVLDAVDDAIGVGEGEAAVGNSFSVPHPIRVEAVTTVASPMNMYSTMTAIGSVHNTHSPQYTPQY